MKQALYDEIRNMQAEFHSLCRYLWEHPEESGKELESSKLFVKLLSDEGFRIGTEPRLPACFVAEFGSGHPVIAIPGEYDALPGMSQKDCAVKEPVTPGAPGHGCGHNLLGSAAAFGAIALKRYLEKEKIPGTIRFYGCPEEELLSGKVKMSSFGMFDGCDFTISWHPMNANIVYDKGYLANACAHYNFTGRTSHAGFAPELGRSALDAVELMNVGVNYLREHVTSAARIHYTTDSGGFAPNIVPAKAGSWYYVRAPKIGDVKEILERIEKVARGAAMMTETSVDVKVDYGCCEMLENHAFADLTYQNLLDTPAPEYTPEELAFAEQINATLAPEAITRVKRLYGMGGSPMMTHIGARNLYLDCPLSASSDTGDMSYMMPMCMFSTATWPIGANPHTWQAAAANGTTLAEKGAMRAAMVFAGIGYDLLNSPEKRDAITKEFEMRKPDYTPMYSG